MRQAITHLKRSDPVLKPWIEKIGPCTMNYRPADFTTLVRSICGQQVSGASARAVYNKLEAATKNRVTPTQVLTLGEEGLRGCGFSRQKTAYVLDLAEHVKSKRIRFADLSAMPDQEVIAALTEVKGIGVWTAQVFLMFALQRRDVLPVLDLGVRAGFKKVHGLEALPSTKELEAYGERWSPWRSVASWYLWRAMDGAADL